MPMVDGVGQSRRVCSEAEQFRLVSQMELPPWANMPPGIPVAPAEE